MKLLGLLYITRSKQIALDNALVASANRLKIGKSNIRLSLDLKYTEATLQVVYDVLKGIPNHSGCSRNIHARQFEELPFEEVILTFLRDLGHSGEIKVIIDVNVNKLHQPWRSFAAVIKKCLSGKSTGYDSLRLSQAQILWGMYHKKNVDYAYLLWEDFVYQVEKKNVKKSNEMYYPRFTKVIVNFFMTKDQSIPRRNSINWHYARDDHMFTMIKVVSWHENTQLYGVILPDDLTNEAIKDLESYKEYYAIALGAEPPKTKASVKKKQVKSDKAKTPPVTKGKRLKTIAKVTKPSMKKQPTQGLETLSEVALIKEEQMRIITKRSLTEYHSSHASGSGADEGTGVTPRVPNVQSENDNDNDDADNQDDDGQEYDEHDDEEHDDEEQGDDDAQTDSDNDGDDFVHPKFSTHDEENKEEDNFDPRVQTPSHVESADDEDCDEEIQDANVEGDKINEEETNEEAEVDALYRDVNVNLEGRDTEMTDAPRIIVQTTQVIEDTHVIITPVNLEGQQQSSVVSSGFISNMLNPSPDTGIDSLFNLNTKSTSLVDVPVTTFAEPPLLSATTLSPPPTPLTTYLKQTPVPTPPTVPSSSVLTTRSSQLWLFIRKSVNEQLKVEVLTRSSNESKTSHVVAANLSELELKNILIDKMESNKLIHRSDEQKNLYKALVDAYESDKLILDTYEDTVSFKRRRYDEYKGEEPSVGSNQGSKRKRVGKEPESTSAPKEKTSKTAGKSTEGSKSHHKSAGKSAQAEEPMHTAKYLEEPKPLKPPTPNRDWNKTLPDSHGPVQPWLSSLAQMEDPRESFNELMDTPLDFSAFAMNRLKVDTLTPELLDGPTFELIKGSCKSLVELEYLFEEVYKETTDQLDWNNPEGQQYPQQYLQKLLPLIPNARGRRVKSFLWITSSTTTLRI
ncbi:hypothetical protein Tco_1339140 [Tanacetum coccineum]